jgi:hypothetical protein
MRKIVLLLLAVLVVPNLSTAAPKHGKKLHAKMSEHNHKKRVKKAAKQDPGAAKHSLLHHKK